MGNVTHCGVKMDGIWFLVCKTFVKRAVNGACQPPPGTYLAFTNW